MWRLGKLASHLLAPDPTALSDVATLSQLPDSRATGLYSKPRLLTNQQMANFIGQGFLSLEVDDVPAEVHRSLHDTAERKWEQSGKMGGAGLGNNCWPGVPQLGQVLRSAVVHGGLQSILGEGYVMNAHRHMHNSSSQGDQNFHKGATVHDCSYHATMFRQDLLQPATKCLCFGCRMTRAQHRYKQSGRVYAQAPEPHHLLRAGWGDSLHGPYGDNSAQSPHVCRRWGLGVP